MTIAGDVMLTLKAMSHFGIIPELNRSKVPDEFLGDINHALDRVLNSAFRETPVSAVDQCRNAVTVILSRWLVQIGYDRAKALMLDLGEIAKAVEAQKDSRECAANLAKVIARLHSRGKMNVQQSLRQVTEEDAELAVQMVGFTLREVGWAV